jgi:hypothetical protein
MDDVDGLGARGAALYKVIGQANGYPLELCARHKQAQNGDNDYHLAFYVHLRFPHSTSAGHDADPARAVGNALVRGVAST